MMGATPGKPPAHGITDHVQEPLEFFRAFPDQQQIGLGA